MASGILKANARSLWSDDDTLYWPDIDWPGDIDLIDRQEILEGLFIAFASRDYTRWGIPAKVVLISVLSDGMHDGDKGIEISVARALFAFLTAEDYEQDRILQLADSSLNLSDLLALADAKSQEDGTEWLELEALVSQFERSVSGKTRFEHLTCRRSQSWMPTDGIGPQPLHLKKCRRARIELKESAAFVVSAASVSGT